MSQPVAGCKETCPLQCSVVAAAGIIHVHCNTWLDFHFGHKPTAPSLFMTYFHLLIKVTCNETAYDKK